MVSSPKKLSMKKSSMKKASMKKRSTSKRAEIGTPTVSASTLQLGNKRKGRSGKYYKVVAKGNKFAWQKCDKLKANCNKGVESGVAPIPRKRSISKK